MKKLPDEIKAFIVRNMCCRLLPSRFTIEILKGKQISRISTGEAKLT